MAGTFYPADTDELLNLVSTQIAGATSDTVPETNIPKALIVPHAGLIYSGEVASKGYSLLSDSAQTISRVVIVGPAHRVPFDGIACSSASEFRTPLGMVPVDQGLVRTCTEKFVYVRNNDRAHLDEHSLEVQLPFLQRVLGSFSLVPLLVGRADPEQIADCLDFCWGGNETLILVSSDLSHFLDYDNAIHVDRKTSDAILALDTSGIDYESACGQSGINALLLIAKRRDMSAELVDLRNSGDTAGPRDRVVGYGCFAFYPSAPMYDGKLRKLLLDTAKHSIEYGLRFGKPGPLPELVGEHKLDIPGACFITLTGKDGELRGCIGSLEASIPLMQNVFRNAYRAAFRDPRFTPLNEDEWADTNVSVSVLMPSERVFGDTSEEVIQQLDPGTSGVTLVHGKKRGTFLPAVWGRLPDAAQFLDALRTKAGIAPETPLAEIEVYRYTTESW